MRDLMQAIKEHKKEVLKYYPETKLLGIFLYGSQNYGIATEDSDVDTKAVLIPSIEDLCLRKPVSHELRLENGEHCEVKDIRELIKMFSKQNINFLEILYTDFCWINPKYNRIWKKYFVNNREKISHMDMHQAIMSICGQAIHTLKQKDSNGSKKYANALRLYYTLKGLIEGVSYEVCINMANQENLIFKKILDYKKGLNCSNEEDKDLLIKKFLMLESISENYNFYDKEAYDILQSGAVALITNEKNHFDFYLNF